MGRWEERDREGDGPLGGEGWEGGGSLGGEG